MEKVTVPTDIWLSIGAYLDPKDYQNLRMSSNQCHLPVKHKMMPLVYAKATQRRRTIPNYTLLVEPFLDIDLDYIKQDIFDFLVCNHDFDKVLRILKRKDPRIDPSKRNSQAIKEASIRKRFDVVAELLNDPRVDPSIEYDLPLLIASRYRRIDILQRICKDPRVDPAMYDFVAFHEALTNDRYDSLEVLMANVSRTVCQEWVKMVDSPVVHELFSRLFPGPV